MTGGKQEKGEDAVRGERGRAQAVPDERRGGDGVGGEGEGGDAGGERGEGAAGVSAGRGGQGRQGQRRGLPGCKSVQAL